MLNGQDTKKLLDAGYKFFRLRTNEGKIYYMTVSRKPGGGTGWKIFSKHPNGMHAQRAMNTLMINPKHLEG